MLSTSPPSFYTAPGTSCISSKECCRKEEAYSRPQRSRLVKQAYGVGSIKCKATAKRERVRPLLVSATEVPIQALVDHTLGKLARAQEDVLKQIDNQNSIISLKAWLKWDSMGCRTEPV
ncbi:hypothetical protein TNCV_141841 [Trichonephila clavipes]|nr:hypothetical protein TNCV_141841 [Trichonephila clavipes]